MGASQLTKRLKSLTALVLVRVESLDDNVEEEGQNGGKLESDFRVVDTANECGDSLQSSNTHDDFAVLERALEDLHELSLGAGELFGAQVHLAEDLKDVHSELTALSRLRAAESHKILNEDILALEF